MAFAEVIFNIPVNHVFTYEIPADMQNLQPGMRVLAPFGKQTITGVTVRITDKTSLSSVKAIIDILDEKPLLSEATLAFTKWISEYYFSSWGQAVQLALAKGIDSEEKEFIHLLRDDAEDELSERQRELYNLIGANPGNSKAYYLRKLGYSSFYYLLARLEEKGVIRREKERVDARVQKLTRKFVLLSAEYPAVRDRLPDFQSYLKRRPEVDEYIMLHLGESVLMSDFLKHTEMSSATLHKMESNGLCQISDLEVRRTPDISFQERDKIIVLTEEQIKVIETVRVQLAKNNYATYLLHGVTGSGKTQVYIEVLKDVLQKGKSAIILIPEIALTPQTVFRFRNAFSENIAVFHSKMSQGERYDAWMACYRGQIRIVVGPRSALFAPLKDIGLIVVDEEHETTYKQTDTVPRYHARDAAIYWARQNNAVVILGSATPSLESYYNARRGKYHLLEIKNRVDHQRLPDVYIVDMKVKRVRIEEKQSLFSQFLLDKIHERISRNEQVILLQNRRGHSAFLQCRSCGFIASCQNCDVTMTYHSFDEKLHCHFCGHNQPAFSSCPVCGEKNINYKGFGTQRIQMELEQLLHGARILRMDQDTTRGKDRHDAILNAFSSGEAQILLGTQMIAKGLDFENVTLVGVISADVGLALPDFRAAERTFQLLTQVAGRSGRSEKGGEVVVQSYVFGHYAIQYARTHDFIGFYMQEVQHRQEFNYPPFFKIIHITVASPKMSEVIGTARQLAVKINRKAHDYLTVVGPSPCTIPRMNNLFRWQLFLKLNNETDPTGNHTKSILAPLTEPYQKRRKEGVQVIVDVDPVTIM